MTTPAAPGSPGGAAPGGPRRRRKPPRRAEVLSVSPVTPRLLSVLVTGDELDGFADAAPTSHLKVFLPAAGQDEPSLPEFTPAGPAPRPPLRVSLPAAGQDEPSLPEFPPDGPVYASDGPPPVVRTYTPRRYDPAGKVLEIQFLLHGEGPASAWAQRAKPGDKLAVTGPGGRFSLEPVSDHWWLAADKSAIPAVATLLEALPETTTVDVHIEVDGPDDEVKLPRPGSAVVTWHHRQPGAYGQELAAAARSAVIPEEARLWVAC